MVRIMHFDCCAGWGYQNWSGRRLCRSSAGPYWLYCQRLEHGV